MVLKQSPRTVYVGAWLIAASYMYCMYLVFLPWRTVLTEISAHFATWMFLAWFAIPLIRRWPLHLKWRAWLIHLGLGIGFTLADIYIAHGLIFLIGRESQYMSLGDFLVDTFHGCFQLAFLTYLALVGIVQGRDALTLAHTRKIELEEQKAAFVRA